MSTWLLPLWEALKINKKIQDYSFGTYKCVAFIISTDNIIANQLTTVGNAGHYITYVKKGDIYNDDNHSWVKWDAKYIDQINEPINLNNNRDFQEIIGEPISGIAFTPLFLRINGTQNLPENIDFNTKYIPSTKLSDQDERKHEVELKI